MKLIGLSCAMAGLLLAGCQKPVAQTEDTSTPNLATDAQAAPIIVRPSTPPLPEYAPPGVFYLLSPVRKETKDGIIRLLPGTEVKLVRNGKYMTPEGEMALSADVLTNDIAKARLARHADQLAQVNTYPPGLPPASATSTTAAPVSAQTTNAPSLAAVTSTFLRTVSPTAPAPHSSTDAEIRNMQFHLSVLKSEEAKLQNNLTYLEEKINFRPHTVGAPSGLSGSTNVGDIGVLNSKLAAVQAEIQTLESKLGTASN